MKKTLLILSLTFAYTISSYSQSDATWEETIGFIEKYKKELHFSSEDLKPYIKKWDNVIVNDKFIKFEIAYEKGGGREGYVEGYKGKVCWEKAKTKIIVTIFFKNLSTDTNREGFASLKFIDENSVKVEKNTDYYGFNTGCDWLNQKNLYDIKSKYNFRQALIGTSNDELDKRVAKAFNHLAKLATDKREAKRKASGDKF
jgi:hypothetical protein